MASYRVRADPQPQRHEVILVVAEGDSHGEVGEDTALVFARVSRRRMTTTALAAALGRLGVFF